MRMKEVTKKNALKLVMAVLLLITAGPSWGGESGVTFTSLGVSSELAAYFSRVSGSEGNFGSVSKNNCYGAFQFCSGPGTYQKYSNGMSTTEFLSNPQAQVNAFMKYEQDQWAIAKQMGYDSALGKEVCYNGKCATITQSSILMACQFGCGQGGAMYNFVKNNYSCADGKATSDGNGTSVCKYLVYGSGFDVSAITKMASDGSSTVIVPMADGSIVLLSCPDTNLAAALAQAEVVYNSAGQAVGYTRTGESGQAAGGQSSEKRAVTYADMQAINYDKAYKDAPRTNTLPCIGNMLKFFDAITSLESTIHMVIGAIVGIVMQILQQVCTAIVTAINNVLANLCLPLPNLGFGGMSFGLESNYCNGIQLVQPIQAQPLYLPSQVYEGRKYLDDQVTGSGNWMRGQIQDKTGIKDGQIKFY